MPMGHELSRSQKIELDLYRKMGIRAFRDFVFAIEGWKHRKDQGKNSNYHLKRMSGSGVFLHRVYLSYNALIHMTGIVLACMILTARRLLSLRWGPADWGMCAAVLSNIYCIMLQRYNALRIEQYELALNERKQKREDKNAAILNERIPPSYDPQQLQSDLQWLRTMEEALRLRQDFRICGEEDAARLDRLAAWTECAGVPYRSTKIVRLAPLRPKEYVKKGSFLYSGTEKRAALLQDRCGRAQESVLRSFAIITEEEKCERAFRRLFPSSSKEVITEVIETLNRAGAIHEQQ